MEFRLKLISVRTIARAKVPLARLLGVSTREAEAVLARLPAVVPLYFERTKADAAAAELGLAGVRAIVEEVPHPVGHKCQTHPKLLNDGTCTACDRWICSVCRALADGRSLCPACEARRRRSERFRRGRVALLLSVLLGVAGWAFWTTQKRAMRTQWVRPVRVALVMVEREPVDVEAIDALRARIPALEAYLAAEAERHGLELARPFDFELLGPVPHAAEMPRLPADAGWIDAARYALRLDEFLEPVDEAMTRSPASFDARIYLLLRSTRTDEEPRFVEGIAELGGELGIVEIDLATDTVDLALLASAHELFHVLGASDKYLPDGSVIVPAGLADPDRQPPFPQHQAEIMARTIPSTLSEGLLPGAFKDVVVGSMTAAEIGWTSAPGAEP